MYDNLLDSNTKIHNTVYWALGGMLLMMIALLGSNILFNYRTNKKEIENIISGMKLEVQEIKNQTFYEMQIKFKEFQESSNKELSINFDKLVENQKAQIKFVTDNLTLKMDTYIKNFEGKVVDQNEVIANERENLKKISAELRDKIELTKLALRVDILQLEAESAMREKVYANALIRYVRMISCELLLGRSLDLSMGSLIKVLKQSDYIPTYYATEFNALIGKIPGEYEIQKNTISELAKSLPIR
jgi:hypothetical protein